MTEKNNTDDFAYLKDVEKYYLTVVGVGIMMSSRDYELIHDWQKRSVPKDVIFRGINKAVEKIQEKDPDDYPKSLYYCCNDIEEEIVIHFNLSTGYKAGSDTSVDHLKTQVLESLARYISEEKNLIIKKQYTYLRNEVSKLVTENQVDLLKQLELLESGFYETIFKSLSLSEQNSIIEEAESMIHEGGRFMTDEAYKESFISFRNETISKKFDIKILS